VSEDSDWTDFSVEANGLILEIPVRSAAIALDGKIQSAIASSILQANALVGHVRGLVTVLVDDDNRVQALNKLWRGIDKPTNVLSFAYPKISAGLSRCIGDIAISYETAAKEAAAECKPFAHHVAHLSVHGFLHLLGYDHESDIAADEMERLERNILASVDVPDPYIARDADG
jgi:probable rRNA maturation factor